MKSVIKCLILTDNSFAEWINDTINQCHNQDYIPTCSFDSIPLPSSEQVDSSQGYVYGDLQNGAVLHEDLSMFMAFHLSLMSLARSTIPQLTP
jgi:hypothetical protein